MGFLNNRETETVTISLAEYKSLQRQSAMLFAIIRTESRDRAAVVEAITKGSPKNKGGGQK